MAKYGEKSKKSIEKMLHEYKRGRAKSGPARRPVKSREQAIAIGLSKARKAGAKVPTPPKAPRQRSKKR